MKVELFQAAKTAVETLQAAGVEVSFATVGHAAATVYLTKRPPDEFICGEVTHEIPSYRRIEGETTRVDYCASTADGVLLKWDEPMRVQLSLTPVSIAKVAA